LATCELTSPGEPVPEHEILEFPFLLCDLEQNLAIVDQGRFFVKPVRTRVSEFCTNLTGITSEFVEQNGQSLQAVVDTIEKAIGSRASSTVLCFDGIWDLSLIRKEFREKNIRVKFPEVWNAFIDLKVEFRRAFPVAEFPDSNCHPVPSLSFMKRYTKAEKKGLTAHQGLDDCIQIHAILEKLLARPGFLLGQPQPYDEFMVPKSFNDMYREPVTLPQLLRALDFDMEQVLFACRFFFFFCFVFQTKRSRWLLCLVLHI
jgi:inhibitor of KinA sporulation pathway (predicted exonuclease)